MKDHVGHRFDLVEKAASECRNMLTKTTAPLAEISKVYPRLSLIFSAHRRRLKNKPVK